MVQKLTERSKNHLTIGERIVQIEAEVVTESGRVERIIDLLAEKYGGMNQIEKYYPKMDVAVEIPLT